ncbi:MAG TPA: sulfotransferase [Sphingomicrobium sp.]|nr:sulfotransferase [Sphingomicrobium sp.]
MSGDAGSPYKPSDDKRLDRPVLIVSSPRSGSTLLFETFQQAPNLYSIGTESHGAIETIRGLRPMDRDWHSNRLTAEDARPDVVEALRHRFYPRLRDRDGKPAEGAVRILEKTPKNALRIPFFDAAWPNSTFVYLYRDVRRTLASMMEAWVSGRFRTYRLLPGWSGYPWSLLLVPGWKRLNGQPLPVIVAHQWAITTTIMLDDLAALPKERVRVIRHADFVADPNARMEALAHSLDLGWDRQLGTDLPLSAYTVSRPNPDKWRQLERQIEAVMPIVAEADSRAREFVASFD